MARRQTLRAKAVLGTNVVITEGTQITTSIDVQENAETPFCASSECL